MVLQAFKKELNSEFERAEMYYNILSIVNNLKLANREIELIAFTAVRGNITNANVRKDFCEQYNSTNSTIGNMVSKLKKLSIFVKIDGLTKVNPVIVLDFKEPLQIVTTLLKLEK